MRGERQLSHQIGGVGQQPAPDFAGIGQLARRLDAPFAMARARRAESFERRQQTFDEPVRRRRDDRAIDELVDRKGTAGCGPAGQWRECGDPDQGVEQQCLILPPRVGFARRGKPGQRSAALLQHRRGSNSASGAGTRST